MMRKLTPLSGGGEYGDIDGEVWRISVFFSAAPVKSGGLPVSSAAAVLRRPYFRDGPLLGT